MSKFLQNLLGAEEPLFSFGLQKLEKITGLSGEDVKLIADINHKTHAVMRRLKLDTSDTTGPELYNSLLLSVKSGASALLLADTDYSLIFIDGHVVSLNMIDVIESAHHQLPFGKQSVSHGRRSLRGEIIARYINHARSHEATTIEIAQMMGLLPEEHSWYTENNHKQK
jgi:hypothetical protein